ncbi:tRNA (adenine(37)-N6)-methyltransferase [Pimephales promelas]|uniref:tRNA (adenine(37)-N6)-methyltransferase n=1 Tax=Pimephales promelas TaxID=90988 RepID=UPI0019555C2B|nr:tRNA (adenine(37)-N6)-methyltransferase [Pimephales promelas]KAG1956905.1 tRNA (adenine(37)-N6)-methyltransferase [Pimephales promelas]
MSLSLCSCAEQVRKLTEQASIMRREIKNLRQQIDGSIRAHKKQLSSIQSMLTDCMKHDDRLPSVTKSPSQSPGGIKQLLEHGRIQTVPIGYINSCFAVKTGTPRQPTICSSSRASLKIEPSVFNNPEHSLVGLEQYSHIWIIFLFHKNGQMSYKAKVKPPRLNGQRVGVYSTRSPHRPNALGLTLAKLERITGDTLHLSGVDIIAGTPVLDIKPYIPDYDSPKTRTDDTNSEYKQTSFTDPMDLDDEPDTLETSSEPSSEHSVCPAAASDFSSSERSGSSDILEEVKNYLRQQQLFPENPDEDKNTDTPEGAAVGTNPLSSSSLRFGHEDYSTIAAWVRAPPVSNLDVRFTPIAEKELKEFLPCDSTDSTRPKFQFLKGPDEAVAAIHGILSADPRSVYRRTRCQDRLFYFTLDTADITCWFGDGCAEVVRVKPVQSSELTNIV